MGYFSIANIRLSAIAAAVPSQLVSNQDLDLLNGTDAQAFVRTVGIRTRRIAPPPLCASDLCLAAAQCILHCAVSIQRKSERSSSLPRLPTICCPATAPWSSAGWASRPPPTCSM